MSEVRAPNYELAENDYMKGMKYKDIATKYNVTINTVKSWKQRYDWYKDKKKGVHTKDEKVCTQNTDDISWVQIEKEYVTDIRKSPCSLENLANKYGIPIQTIKDMSAKSSWSKKRVDYKLRTNQKIIEKSVDQDADRIIRLLNITDIAASKAEQSLNELETYLVTNKKKVKVIEYHDSSAPGKPTKEVINEDESIETMNGPVDRQGLLYVTSSLKNIKELYSITASDKKQQEDTERNKAQIGLIKAQTDKLTGNNQEIEDTSDVDGDIYGN